MFAYLLVVLLLQGTRQAVVKLTAANQTATLGRVVMSNNANISLLAYPIAPYLELVSHGSNNYSIAYDFGVWPIFDTAKPRIIMPVLRRADSGANLRIAYSLSGSCFVPNPAPTFTLRVRTAASQYTATMQLQIVVVNPFIEIRLPIFQMETFPVGTLNYSRYTWLGHTDFYFVQSIQGMAITETLDFTKFLQHSIAYNLISPLDIVDQVVWAARLDFLSCSINFSLPLDDGGRLALHQDGSIVTSAGDTFQRHSFLNVTSSEYFNVSYVDPPASAADIVVDYLLNSTPAALRGIFSTKVGWFNNTWETPPAARGLPSILSSANFSITATLNYTKTVINASIPAVSWSCIVASLRNDTYLNLTSTFSTGGSYPTRQIYVCSEASGVLSVTPSVYVKDVNYTGAATYQFQQWWGSATSTDLTATWPIHVYLSKVVGAPISIDILSFSRYLCDQGALSASETVVGVQVAISAFSGSSKYSLIDLGIVQQFPAVLPTVVQVLPSTGVIPPALLPVFSAPAPLAPPIPPQPIPMPSPTDSLIPQQPAEPANSLSALEIFQNSLLGVMSVPNLNLLLKITTVLRFVDDLSYYNYHQSVYDSEFRFYVQMAWNLTNMKWLPQSLSTIYREYLGDLSVQLSHTNQQSSPASWLRLGETVNFAYSTMEYWCSAIPISILSFMFLHIVVIEILRQGLLKRFLKNFSTHWSLLTCLIGENVQYLSFRCFSQLLSTEVASAPSPIYHYFNLALTYVVLFFLVVFACCFYPLLSCFNRKILNLLSENTRHNVRVESWLGWTCFIRLTSGAIHALLYNYSFLQISCLLFLSCLELAGLVLARNQFSKASVFWPRFFSKLLKIILQCLLLVEVHIDMSEASNDQIGILTLNLLLGILTLEALEIILNYTVGWQQGTANIPSLQNQQISKGKRKKKIIPMKNRECMLCLRSSPFEPIRNRQLRQIRLM